MNKKRPSRKFFRREKMGKKKGRSLNPSDAYRKQQRKKEIQKVRIDYYMQKGIMRYRFV